MQMKNKFKKYPNFFEERQPKRLGRRTRDREKIVNTTNVVKKDRFQDDTVEQLLSNLKLFS